MDSNGLGSSDNDSVIGKVTKEINGGVIGLEQRKIATSKAKELICDGVKIIFNINVFLFLSKVSHAEYYNEVNYNTYHLKLNKKKKGSIDIRNSLSGLTSNCEISGWSKLESKGAGIISLTSDKLGVLVSPGNKYFFIEGCN